MNGTITSVSELRRSLARAVAQLSKKGEPLIIFQRSRPKAVLADFDYFSALEEAVLDFTDAREAEKAKKEPRVTLAEYTKKRWG